ncbi:MAG: MotA/TolQ/ExbB proton channel family protein [bacterium]
MPLIAAAGAEEGNVLLSYLEDGGWMMYVILTVSLFGTAMFLERAFNLYVLRRLNSRAFVSRIVSNIENRRFREAIDATEASSKHPLVAVAKAGLIRSNRREKEIERAMENEMLAAIPGLQARITIMAVLANIATLLGLLGTIFGLITAFSSVAAASAAERQEALAGGISQAMYTTAFGISVAVPLLLFHHFLSKRVESILMEMESGASSILVALSGVRGDTGTDGRAQR